MTNQIQYRGASISINEYRDARSLQHYQEQAPKHISYRGAEADVQLEDHAPRKVDVSYRGAHGIVEL